MKGKKLVSLVLLPGVLLLFYVGGVLGQIVGNYHRWLSQGGITGGITVDPVSFHPGRCFRAAFSLPGLQCMLVLLLIAAGILLWLKYRDRFSGTDYDSRGFTKSRNGTYGTANWMTQRQLREILQVSPAEKAGGMILGMFHNQVVSVPEKTMLNRHCAIFGASGTMKSRAIIRNALFQTIRCGESAVITDPKGELYNDTAQMFRNSGYEVKVLNLVHPEHSDCWNCMADLGDDPMMAEVLTNVIIGNTGMGKGDAFWDNGEKNLLKAIVLYIALNPTLLPEDKNLAAVYRLLLDQSGQNLSALFERLSPTHPARAPFGLFSQASETVKTGIILGLGTRLAVLQNESVQELISRSDLDLTAPGARKCAYYIILSDQEASMAFLSSLFFSFLFIRLVRFADASPQGRCPVPVNLILDEFNNIGKIGGAADGSDFARSLSVIRSRNIRVTMAVQSLGQLQNRYPNNLWAEILGNCDIQLMLGCTDDVTAQYFSSRSGEMSIEVTTVSTVKKTMAAAQMIPQYRESTGQGRRKLLTPDEVLRLPNDEMLVIIRGQNILKLQKFDYTGHPMAGRMVKTSILDYTPRRACTVRPSSPRQAASKPRASRTVRQDSQQISWFSKDTPPEDF